MPQERVRSVLPPQVIFLPPTPPFSFSVFFSRRRYDPSRDRLLPAKFWSSPAFSEVFLGRWLVPFQRVTLLLQEGDRKVDRPTSKNSRSHDYRQFPSDLPLCACGSLFI